MIFRKTPFEGLLLIEPKVFADERGFLMETHNQRDFTAAGLQVTFVQQNHVRSVRNTLRGLHFQDPNPQGKLVRCLSGEIFDVAVDIRPGSRTFGKWFSQTLTGDNRLQIYIPPGFAHGFCVLSDFADVLYSCTVCYSPESEHGIRWDDPDLAIPWPVRNPILSAKDRANPAWQEFLRDS